jgi:hypothetical protein
MLASFAFAVFAEDIRVDLPFAAKVHERRKKFIDSQLDKKMILIQERGKQWVFTHETTCPARMRLNTAMTGCCRPCFSSYRIRSKSQSIRCSRRILTAVY